MKSNKTVSSQQDRSGTAIQSGTIFSRNLKKQRLLKKVTQEFMAGKLNVTTTAYGKWESGKRDPGTAMVITISDVLGIEPGILFEREQ